MLEEEYSLHCSTTEYKYSGRQLVGYGGEEEVWVVLEEDGTEVKYKDNSTGCESFSRGYFFDLCI